MWGIAIVLVFYHGLCPLGEVPAVLSADGLTCCWVQADLQCLSKLAAEQQGYSSAGPNPPVCGKPLVELGLPGKTTTDASSS